MQCGNEDEGSDRWERVVTKASSQRGLITAEQLTTYFSRTGIGHLRRSGRIKPIRRGVFCLVGAEVGPDHHIFAAVLAGGDTALASHRSAAALWNLRLPQMRERRIEMTVDNDRRIELTGVKTHYSSAKKRPVSVVRGIPVTPIEWTLLDLGAIYSRTVVERIAEDAVIRKLTTFEAIARTFAVYAKPGRAGVSNWKEILEDREDLKSRTDSALAQRVLKIIRKNGLPLPIVEYRVRVDHQSSRYLDLAYPDLRIDIECDGRAAHQSVRFDDDRRRDREMNLRRWLVLRFTWNSTEAEIVRDVSAAIAMRMAA